MFQTLSYAEQIKQPLSSAMTSGTSHISGPLSIRSLRFLN